MGQITVTTRKLKVAGANGKRVDLLGKFLSLAEAQAGIANGSIVPDPDSVNVKSTVEVYSNSGKYEYEWSHSLSAFTQIGRGDGSTALANAYIMLRGTDEHIGFEQVQAGNPVSCLLNLDTDFSLSVKIPVIDTPENGQRIKLIENGQNAIQINMGSGNYGLYFTDGSISAGVNVFSEITANNELTFVYTSANKQLKYYINGLSKGTLSLSNRTNNADGNIKLGKETGANRLRGGVNDMVVYSVALSSNDIQQVKDGVPIEQRDAHGDAVAYVPMGEDVYPTVSDKLGNLQDGQLYNGSPDDFVEIV